LAGGGKNNENQRSTPQSGSVDKRSAPQSGSVDKQASALFHETIVSNLDSAELTISVKRSCLGHFLRNAQ
jgi:hypothetical protein